QPPPPSFLLAQLHLTVIWCRASTKLLLLLHQYCCCSLRFQATPVTEVPESETVEPEPEVGEEAFVETEENQGEPELVFGHFYPVDPSVGDE
ncbi:unnamed protein product, partial [Urochloa humidicola]